MITGIGVDFASSRQVNKLSWCPQHKVINLKSELASVKLKGKTWIDFTGAGMKYGTK